MGNKYLTKNKKNVYMDDFKNLLSLEIDFWKIDNQELKDILININKNQNIQTLYSKFVDKSNAFDCSSYLTFTYSKKVELNVFRFLVPFFVNEYNFNSNRIISRCNYDFYQPKINLNYEKKSKKFGAGCVDNIDYFKINHIKISLESSSLKIHNEFWKDLKIKFNELT